MPGWRAVEWDRHSVQWEQMQVNSLDTVMVTGLGPVGLGGIINARYRGARVIGVESHPYRAELAKKLGADIVLNPTDEDILDQIHDFTDGIGVDKALDCSGASAAHRFDGRCRPKKRAGYVHWRRRRISTWCKPRYDS